MEHPPTSPARIRRLTILGLAGGIFAVGAMLFLTASTFDYWQAWVYLLILFVPLTHWATHLVVRNPGLLARRLRSREVEPEQRRIIAASTVVLLTAFIIPGLDRRFGWSSLPIWMVLAADTLVFLSYVWLMLVLRENEYAARTVQVEPRQRVITTGPYAVVRHPMYGGVTLMYGFSPLALGSAWAMIPVALLPVILAARILNEERLLLRDLEGYAHYCRRVRHRCIPGLW